MSDFDTYAGSLDRKTVDAVVAASAAKTSARAAMLGEVFADVESARSHASLVKQHVLDHLGAYLAQLEAACGRNGIRVHWAEDAAEARRIIAGICLESAPRGATVVKAKSMATEEIHLNAALEADGFEVVETDLGEFVVQIDGDTPSHIVTPIIHKDRGQVAASFFREGLGPYSEDPEVLTMQARAHLRSKFRQARVGISGVNFAIAETGRLVLVENEGNSRLSTTAPPVHIALMGIEKVLPREADLPLFLRLLAGSATGQRLTVYTHLIQGPRQPGSLDGPEQVHLVLLDNGRVEVLNGPYRPILRCIRCGACLNVCPVYRQASGHAYGHVYSGPLGAVLGPAMGGVRELGEMAKASTLCGACEEVCPVAIPIPHLLLHLRDEAFRSGVKGRVPWGALATMATNDARWRAALRLSPALRLLPRAWGKHRNTPRRVGRAFRRWWNERP